MRLHPAFGFLIIFVFPDQLFASLLRVADKASVNRTAGRAHGGDRAEARVEQRQARFHRGARARRLPVGVDPHPEPEAASPLAHIEDMVSPATDIEMRQRPVHVTPDTVDPSGLMVPDLNSLLAESNGMMSDCLLIHEYAEPLTVRSEVREAEASLGKMPPLVRQGAVWDEGHSSTNEALAVEMFAYLSGISGLVQVVPHGIVARWTSKEKVPIGGFLCNHHTEASDLANAAPVLHAAPTPCIPTALDQTGGFVDPTSDGYEVFIGSTRVRFESKAEADEFCTSYALKIANDLSATVWDASSLGDLLPEMSPSLPSFVARTRRTTSPEGWTKGIKKLLVVVMDWKYGDQSLAPYSKQDSDPIGHYRTKIFPEVDRHFREMSYGQFGLDVDIVPTVIRYTRDRTRYSAQGMPFPGLYFGAQASLEGTRSDYKFASYDLVYVIAPQVRPMGTKGVAYVGKKGAMCNGCETLSDNFKIMVAVHELGHNLGLFHASSTSLEYGNPFDWMGNYPDVVGLSYGIGYLASLGWIPDSAIYTVRDSNLRGLSVAVNLSPFDTPVQPGEGHIVGVQVSLAENTRDLWIAYRSMPSGGRNGIFLTYQEKDQANSELIDLACHSPSQQDARLRVGWTFLDRSHRLAVKVTEVTATNAKVHLFEVPPQAVPRIYGRDTFTDGETKCPVTCQDANWLVTQYNCADLSSEGHCGAGLTMLGKTYRIDREICPQACGKCSDVLATTPLLVSGGCKDSNIKISEKTCAQAAASGWCSYSTTGGSSVGKDLCPMSCGTCPKTVIPSSALYTDPTPKKTVGSPSAESEPRPPPTVPPTPAPRPSTSAPAPPPWVQEGEEPDEAGEESSGGGAEDDNTDDDACEDDPNWVDQDGDGCAEYAKVIRLGNWDKETACSYGDGGGKLYCRATCGTCEASGSTCADRACIGLFMKVTGRCEQCADWSRFCKYDWFEDECPMTCGDCSGTPLEGVAGTGLSSSTPASQKPSPSAADADKDCADEGCIEAWRVGERCPTCQELGRSFCAEEVFASACPAMCDLCVREGVSEICADVYSTHTCRRYKSYGWCEGKGMRLPVRRQCPLTCGACDEVGDDFDEAPMDGKSDGDDRVYADEAPQAPSQPSQDRELQPDDAPPPGVPEAPPPTARPQRSAALPSSRHGSLSAAPTLLLAVVLSLAAPGRRS
jgi:hypothetical protein